MNLRLSKPFASKQEVIEKYRFGIEISVQCKKINSMRGKISS
jgi:hypothetical protein